MQLLCVWCARLSLVYRLPMLLASQTFQIPVRSSFIRLDVKQFTGWNPVMRKATRDIADGTALVEFPHQSAERANEAAVRLWRQLTQRQPAGFLDAIVGARTLTVLFDPTTFEPGSLELQDEETQAADVPVSLGVRVPVCYGGALGPDLDQLARSAGLSVSR